MGAWTVHAATNLSAKTDPPLAAVPTATVTVPFMSSIPACSPASTFPAAPVGSTTLIKFEVFLFPEYTSFTPGAGEETVEVLKGNVKSALTIASWPFCFPDHKLVVEMGLKSTKLGASDAARDVVVKTGQEAEQAAEQLATKLFDAVDAEEEEEEEVTATRRRLLAADDDDEDSSMDDAGEKDEEYDEMRRKLLSKPDPEEKPKLSCGGALDKAVEEAAAKGKDLAESIKAKLQDKVAKKRPVSGLGRPAHADRLFISLPGSGSIDSKVDVPKLALIDGEATNITVTAPTRSQGQGVQKVVLTFPSFSQLSYDPTTAFAASDSATDVELQGALAEVGTSGAQGACHLAGLLALAGAAGALLML